VQEVLPPRMLERGSFSAIHEDMRLALLDVASWKAVWTRHRPDTQAPAFDVGNETVLAVVVHGPTGCAGIRLGDITFDGVGVTTVDVVHETAPENVRCFAAFQDVYEFAAVPWREGEVRFTDRDEPAPSAPTPSGPAREAYPFRTLAQGQSSGVTDLRRQVLADEGAWRAFWDEHTSTVTPVPALPFVDFSSEQVFVATAGDRSDACWRLDIERIDVGESDVGVLIRTQGPTPDRVGCLTMITQPHHFVTYPITDKTLLVSEVG
jgi:hypothetical protein